MRKLDESAPVAPAYVFWGFTIPEYMLEALKRYIEYGQKPGGFLTAVISNDLRNAVARADDHNIVNLRAYIGYLHNEAPANCWGSYDNMQQWLNHKQKERLCLKQSSSIENVITG